MIPAGFIEAYFPKVGLYPENIHMHLENLRFLGSKFQGRKKHNRAKVGCLYLQREEGVSVFHSHLQNFHS
jgi:hypothetical protein